MGSKRGRKREKEKEKDTYGRRWDRLKWRQKQATWLGAGLVGLIALIYSDVSFGLLSESPGWLQRLVVSLPLAAGEIGRAHV